jgi:hypothetical protein
MNEEDLERALRRYRVVGPPRSLAAGILAQRVARGAGHGWGAFAAAAIVAIWLLVHATQRPSVLDPVRERDVAAIAFALGGGEDMRQYAEQIVPRRQATDSLEFAQEIPW